MHPLPALSDPLLASPRRGNSVTVLLTTDVRSRNRLGITTGPSTVGSVWASNSGPNRRVGVTGGTSTANPPYQVVTRRHAPSPLHRSLRDRAAAQKFVNSLCKTPKWQEAVLHHGHNIQSHGYPMLVSISRNRAILSYHLVILGRLVCPLVIVKLLAAALVVIGHANVVNFVAHFHPPVAHRWHGPDLAEAPIYP